MFFFKILFKIYTLYKYKAGAPYREDSKLSLKRVKRDGNVFAQRYFGGRS